MKLTFDSFRWSQDQDGFWLHLRVAEKAGRLFLSAFQAGKRYIADLKEERKKRSMDANSYYWVLISALAPALHISTSAAHNLMLRRYGQPEVIEDKMVYLVIPETENAEKRAMESDTYHIKPTSETRVGNDGGTYRTYIMLKGSREYDTKEMSVLIDGIVSECKEIGIETKTPEELEIIKARWADAPKNKSA